ncbi:hypothetical protein LXL04_006230 [Taraxacum kok-saghyz]
MLYNGRLCIKLGRASVTADCPTIPKSHQFALYLTGIARLPIIRTLKSAFTGHHRHLSPPQCDLLSLTPLSTITVPSSPLSISLKKPPPPLLQWCLTHNHIIRLTGHDLRTGMLRTQSLIAGDPNADRIADRNGEARSAIEVGTKPGMRFPRSELP